MELGNFHFGELDSSTPIILMNILTMKNSSAVWKEFFLDRLAQLENIATDSDLSAPCNWRASQIILRRGKFLRGLF
jgi:hypothetical protein